MTPEQRAQRQQEIRHDWDSMTDEQRAERHQKIHEGGKQFRQNGKLPPADCPVNH